MLSFEWMRKMLERARMAGWLISGIPFLVGCNPLGSTALDPSFFSSYQIKLSPPVILEALPAAQSINVALNADIVIRFDKAMSASTLNAGNVSVQVQAGAEVLGNISVTSTVLANDTMTFTPAVPWSNAQAYEVSLSSSITDIFQDSLAPSSWRFTTVPLFAPTSVTYLLVGGGGGGGVNGGGGGGGGGILFGSLTVSSGSVYSVVVGEGGAPHFNTPTGPVTGGSSVFGPMTALGGGGGPSRDAGTGAAVGGSGGGGAGATDSVRRPGALGTLGQGNAGGSGAGDLGCDSAGAGGGGAGSAGADAAWRAPGNGGSGISSSISGTLTYYAGGGGGASTCYAINAVGGLGGGGNGDSPGTTNTGGGGGGTGQPGGSGTVIVSYPDSYALPQNLVGSPRFSHVGGNYIFQWTGVGIGSLQF